MSENFDKMMGKYADKCSKICRENNQIDVKLFEEFGVKRGLRDKNGKGVLSGITNISLIKASEKKDGRTVPCDGQLYYRGYNIFDLTKGFRNDKRFGFEETAYLLLFGDLPNKDQLVEFQKILAKNRRLPTNFVRDVIMKAPSKDIMNSLTKSVLTLSSYDDKVTDNSLENVLRQSLLLIGVFPLLSVYGYHAYNHYECDESFTSTALTIICQQLKISCACSVPIRNTRMWRRRCWIWRWYFIWSMEEETIPHLPPGWSRLPALILIPSSPPLSPPSRGRSMAVRISKWCR